MPRFDFHCTPCSHTFEASVPFGHTELPVCPLCAGKTEKLISAPLGIHFKGEGFYRTDSQKSLPKKEGEGKNAETGDTKEPSQPNDSKKSTKETTKDPPKKDKNMVE